MPPELPEEQPSELYDRPVAENPDDVADQAPLTVEADMEVPTAALVRRGWATSTFESFAHRDFTLFWSGALVSNVGTWMQNAALAILVYRIQPDKASLNTGIVQGLAGLPVLFLAIPAGALADRVDRRKLLIWLQVVLLAQAAAIGILYDAQVLSAVRPLFSLVLVSALGLVGGIFVAFQGPAFQSMLPDLVPRKSLMNGIALNSAQLQTSRMLGPAIVAGMLLVGSGLGLIFYINAASFLFVIAALLAIRPRAEFHAGHGAEVRGAPDGKRAGNGRTAESAWQTLTAGISYAREHPAIGVLILTTAFLVFFGFPYVIILTAIIHARIPGLNDKAVEHVYAVVYAFNGAGALIGSLAVAGLPSTIQRNRIIPITLLTFAALVVAFSFAPSVPVMCAITLVAGAAYISTSSLVMTSIQAAVPGYLRGRVMALFMMAFMGVMPLSAFAFGPLGQAIGPDTAVLVGGVALAVWALVLIARPGWLDAIGTPNASQRTSAVPAPRS
ncbi:MAG: MFS transporter [Coriobacteriia bacterium]|nr:MFS transporter [Coriobacteriia bacterium]